MPILFQISVEVNSGSVGRIAEQIGVTAIANGWNSYIAYARNHNASKSNVIKIGSKVGIAFHVIVTRIFDAHCLASRLATKRLVKQIEEIKPDVILLHHIHGYYINMVVLFDYLRCSGIPVFWLFHDCWSFTGHCAYFTSVDCCLWQSECYNCPQRKRYPASLVFDRSQKNFKTKKKLFTSVKDLSIICVSDWLAGLVSQSFFKNKNTYRIYNGVDTKTFHPSDFSDLYERYHIPHKHILLGVATDWGDRKGWKDYIKLSTLVGTDFIIVMVGVSEDQKNELSCYPNIIAVRRTESVAELAKFYTAALVVLNLSEEETFGLTTVEGYACGTPSIVYNCTASPELVDETTGFVVEKHDVKSVLKCIFEIERKDKDNYSNACISKVKKQFESSNQFQQYIDLFELSIKQ